VSGPDIGWIVVARIAPEPISTNVAVTEFRSRPSTFESRANVPAVQDDPLPPVPTPVPTPVPGPIVAVPSEAFAAALAAEQMPTRVSVAEVRLRTMGGWQAPSSSLRLTDRRV
jgi:hypothetical protein